MHKCKSWESSEAFFSCQFRTDPRNKQGASSTKLIPRYQRKDYSGALWRSDVHKTTSMTALPVSNCKSLLLLGIKIPLQGLLQQMLMPTGTTKRSGSPTGQCAQTGTISFKIEPTVKTTLKLTASNWNITLINRNRILELQQLTWASTMFRKLRI